MANQRRIVRRGTRTPKKPQSRMQFHQEFVTMENAELLAPFLGKGEQLQVELEHDVQEVISVRTSPSGHDIKFDYEPGMKFLALDWERLQSLPDGREVIIVEYYQTLPFDTKGLWERFEGLIEETATASTISQKAVVEFLLRKLKAQHPEVFARIAGKEPY